MCVHAVRIATAWRASRWTARVPVDCDADAGMEHNDGERCVVNAVGEDGDGHNYDNDNDGGFRIDKSGNGVRLDDRVCGRYGAEREAAEMGVEQDGGDRCVAGAGGDDDEDGGDMQKRLHRDCERASGALFDLLCPVGDSSNERELECAELHVDYIERHNDFAMRRLRNVRNEGYPRDVLHEVELTEIAQGARCLDDANVPVVEPRCRDGRARSDFLAVLPDRRYLQRRVRSLRHGAASPRACRPSLPREWRTVAWTTTQLLKAACAA